MTFVKGQSGNPAGRRKGSRNKVTELAEELAGAGVEEMTRRLMAEASLGNGAALRVYFDRIWPKRRGAPIKFEMPPVRSLADVPVAHAAICQGVTDGELSVEEFEMLSRGVNHMKRSLDEAEIDARLERHEAMLHAMAKGLGAKFESASSPMWRAGEPVGKRPDGVRFAEPAESREAGVASAADLQESGLASAADLQGGVASAADLQGAPVAPATNLEASDEPQERHEPAPESGAPPAPATNLQAAPLASAADLQAGQEARRPDGVQREPGEPASALEPTRPDPSHATARELPVPLASGTNLQSAPAAKPHAAAAPPDPKANGHDDAWMREFLGPEYGVPWQGYRETRRERSAA
jgi:hypothetical protein